MRRTNTIRRHELGKIEMVTRGEKRISKVILDGTVYCWVGIGWVIEGKPTDAQRRALPVVVD